MGRWECSPGTTLGGIPARVWEVAECSAGGYRQSQPPGLQPRPPAFQLSLPGRSSGPLPTTHSPQATGAGPGDWQSAPGEGAVCGRPWRAAWRFPLLTGPAPCWGAPRLRWVPFAAAGAWSPARSLAWLLPQPGPARQVSSVPTALGLRSVVSPRSSNGSIILRWVEGPEEGRGVGE